MHIPLAHLGFPNQSYRHPLASRVLHSNEPQSIPSALANTVTISQISQRWRRGAIRYMNLHSRPIHSRTAISIPHTIITKISNPKCTNQTPKRRLKVVETTGSGVGKGAPTVAQVSKKRSRHRGVCASCFLTRVGLHLQIGVAARSDLLLNAFVSVLSLNINALAF